MNAAPRRSVDYTMISADDHLDLQYLPTDLWTKRLPSSLRDRAAHVETRDGGSVWVCDGHLLWASDYPHPDSTWPNSRQVVDRQMGDLAPEVRKQLTRDNAAALYGL